MPNKIVVLEKPIVGHKPLRQLEFREPKFRDLMEIGDPFVWVPAGEYSRRVDDLPAIEKYAERLLVENGQPGDPLILDQLGIKDTRNVREALISFFQDAVETAASKTSDESSSSTQDSTPEPSTT